MCVPLHVQGSFITSFHLNPLENGMILLLLLGQESLDPESLVGRHGEELIQSRRGWREEERASCFSYLPLRTSSNSWSALASTNNILICVSVSAFSILTAVSALFLLPEWFLGVNRTCFRLHRIQFKVLTRLLATLPFGCCSGLISYCFPFLPGLLAGFIFFCFLFFLSTPSSVLSLGTSLCLEYTKSFVSRPIYSSPAVVM